MEQLTKYKYRSFVLSCFFHRIDIALFLSINLFNEVIIVTRRKLIRVITTCFVHYGFSS